MVVNALVQLKASCTEIIDMVGVFDIIANLIIKHPSRVDDSDKDHSEKTKILQ